MRISSEHQTQSVLFSDFSGGLDTSMTQSDIQANELAVCTNMEVDRHTHLLKTVKGCRQLCTVTEDIKSATYDVLNDMFLLFTESGKVLATQNFADVTTLGNLTGTNNVVTTLWEDGTLIASGGQLQYYNGKTLTTIETSPEHCMGVYTRSGRVLTFDKADTVLYSGVGDETNWEQDSNDPSSSLFAQIGYKVGGRIIGAVNLSKDILFIKSNGMVFRLQNEYPDWRISELGRQIYCRSTAGFTNIGDNVVILGDNVLQSVTTTQDYGDMKPQDIGQKVTRELAALPSDTKLRYVPAWNQLWFITNENYALVMDCNTGGFFERAFSKPVVDIVSDSSRVYLIRQDGICDFVEELTDCGKPLQFHAKFKTSMDVDGLLVKRITMGITPFSTELVKPDAYMSVGKVRYPFPRREIKDPQIEASDVGSAGIERSGELSGNTDSIYMNSGYSTPTGIIAFKQRCVYHSRYVTSEIEGNGVAFILNYFGYDVAKV